MTAPLLRVPHARPLLAGRLIARYDRFLAEVDLDGEVVTAHCVNPGRMEGVVVPGAEVWLSKAPEGSKRRLRYTWELVRLPGEPILGANTNAPNGIVRAALEARVIRGLTRFDELVPERRYGEGSRIDFWLRRGRREHFVEVKNCHLVYPDGRGYFPDSVSARASKHLEELIEVVRRGHQATVLFTIQRPDVRAIRPSDVHDPTFAENLRLAHAAGVRFRALTIRPTLEAYQIEGFIPVDVRPYRTARIAHWREDNQATSGWIRRAWRARGGTRASEGAGA